MLAAIREARHALVRTPAFSATAILSIGIAIGLAGSVVSVVWAAFFGRLPYPEPDRLVELWQTPGPGSAQPSDYLAPVRMLEWVDTQWRHLENVSATGMAVGLILERGDALIQVQTVPVIGDWFSTMAVPAAQGRVLTADDLQPGSTPAAVVTSRFAREKSVDVGTTISLSGVTYTVVGIMPPEFDSDERVWVAEASLPDESRSLAYAGVARVRAGSTAAEAALEIQQASAAQVAVDSARYAGLGATARPIGALARGADRPRLWMLSGVVAAVILIGLSNLTQIFLVRAQGRSRGLAIRGALGGSTWEIGRSLVAEGAIVGLLGGGFGLVLAVWGRNAVRAFLGGEYVFPSDPVMGTPVIAFSLVVALLVSVSVGLEPLRRIASLDLNALLQRHAGGSSATRAERRTQRVMVALQVTACVVLVATAAVLGSAYRTLHSLDLGYDADVVVQAQPDYDLLRMNPPSQWATARAVAERLREDPALSGVAVWEYFGEDYPPRPEIDAVFDGAPRAIGRFDRLTRAYTVEPGFFDVMGIDIVAGRALSEIDAAGQPPVAVVTKGGADAWWPGEDPIGHQVKLGAEGAWMTVVGVAESIQELHDQGATLATIGRQPPIVFAPYSQMPTPPVGWRPFGCCAGVMVGVRPTGPASAAIEALRSAFAVVEPRLPVEVDRMSTLHVSQGYAGSSIILTGRMVAAGAIVALVLAALGIVGVVREAVGRRTKELGLRIALGARGHQIVTSVAAESAYTALVGVATGLAAIFVLDRTLSSVVFGFEVQRLTDGVLDPGILLVATAVVSLGAAATAAATAARATRIDPVEALRSE
jgi:putative ABC transport system permease protein